MSASVKDYPTPAPTADLIRKLMLAGRHPIILNKSRSTESEKRAATTIAVNTGAQKLGAWFFGQYQHLADPKDFANFLRPLLGH